jgi:PTS system mannose-specific IIB component
MRAILLIGHGDLPLAMKQTAQMIAGELPFVHTVSLQPDDGKESFAKKLATLEEKISDSSSIQIFADLLGGSPANGALEKYAGDSRVQLITGMNLPMVLAAVMAELDAGEVIKAGIQGIQEMNQQQPVVAKTTDPQTVKPKPVSTAPFSIENVRVDARGIHGQVATQWIPKLGVNRVVVIDDFAIADETQKLALKMAKPNSVKLSVLSSKKAAERLKDPQSYPGEKLLVIIQRIDMLEALLKQGFRFDTVNMGNVPNRPDTKSYRKTVHLTEKEKTIIQTLIQAGTHFTAQMVPNDASVDFDALIKE